MLKMPVMAGLVLLSLSTAYAAECEDAMTQFDMNQCADAAYSQTERLLEKAYHDVWQRTDGKQRQLLEAAQQRWYEYRNADCLFQSDTAQQGSIGPMVHAQCLTDAAVERIKILKRVLSCPEGALDCVSFTH